MTLPAFAPSRLLAATEDLGVVLSSLEPAATDSGDQ